jgi:hypothetical protein
MCTPNQNRNNKTKDIKFELIKIMKKNPRKIQNYLRNTHGKLDFIENVRG